MRIKRGVASRRRKKRLLKQTKGYWGRRKNVVRRARETLLRALAYSYRDRKQRKRDFRRLWIVRINAAVRPYGLSYSRFIAGLKASGIEIDRKSLAELAVREPTVFKSIVEKAQASIH